MPKKCKVLFLTFLLTLWGYGMEGVWGADAGTVVFSVEDAATIWGQPAKQKSSSPLTLTFVPASDSPKLELHIYARSLEGVMSSLQAAKNFQAQADRARGASTRFLAADVIGDATFWNAEFRQLAVFAKGHVFLITATSPDEGQARKFAQAAAEIIVAKL